MNRSEFLSRSVCSCLATCFLPVTVQHSPDFPSTGVTSCEKRFEFAQLYVKRLMDILETELDEQAGKKLVQAMGETCARGAYGDKENIADKIPVADFVARIKGKMEGNYINWEYTGNHNGLKITDGYCLCPITETGPEGLSGLWCECSVGYVRYMFERYTPGKFDVELLESLKRNVKRCRFRITVI
jgi:hypothetical protein